MDLSRLLLLCLSAALAAPLRAETLVGVTWSAPGELAALPGVLRWVAPGVALLSTDGPAPGVLFRDRAAPGEGYYLADHLHGEPAAPVRVVYRDPRGWALLRLPQDRLVATLDRQDFLFPLPESYALPPLTAPTLPSPTLASRRPAARAPAAEVASLLGQVDPARLRDTVERLSLVDVESGSVPGNIRSRYARRPETYASTTYLHDRLAAVLGDGAVRLDTFRIAPGDSLMYNVVGELAGTDPDAGYYVICAHYDAIGTRSRRSDLERIGESGSGSWDWRTQPAPGADDNATGVAVVLESARLLSQRRFPWSIRFIAWSGEELGLWGSRHYADRARARDDRVLGVLNFDMVGFNDLADRLELVTNPASTWLVDLLRQTNQRYDLGLQVDVLADRFAGLSDHAPFWAEGYDAILGIENYLPTDTTSAGVRAGDYRINTQYHSVADLPDSVNYELVARVTRLTVAALAQFGSEQGLPNLAIFGGDLRGDPADDLRLLVANLGPADLRQPFAVRLSRCGADSSGCDVIYETTHSGPVAAGAVAEVTVPWQRYGDAVFFAEVDPAGRVAEEVEDADNRAFFNLRLVPHDEVVVFPNPFQPARDGFVRFSGVPLYARLGVYRLGGPLVWRALEEEQGERSREIRWTGVNAEGFAVGSGIYVYDVRTFEGQLLRRGKIAVVR